MASVTVDQIEEATGLAGSEPQVPPLAQLGYKIFRYLLLLIAFVGVLLVVYALTTYPSQDEIQEIIGNAEGVEALQAWRETRAEWVDQFKDLGQLFLVTPIVPLLGAVLGYIFGRQQAGQAA